jgi:delta24-sterol reductase
LASNAMQAHEDAVAGIVTDLRRFFANRKPYRVYHGSSNSTRTSSASRSQMVDTSGLKHVLAVDTTKRTALVEPNVPMDALVEATLKHNLIPKVVMEFPGITVGGGFSGTSFESSTFKYGLFECTINWIEIVTPNGEVLKASSAATEHPDLFYAAAGSFGTHPARAAVAECCRQ